MWYVSMDTNYRYNLTPDPGACAPNHPVLEYRAIMMAVIDYIETNELIRNPGLTLALHQVLKTHCSIDCFEHVANNLRAELYQVQKCTKAHRAKASYPFSFGCQDPDWNNMMSDLWGENRCIACEEPDKPYMLRSMNEDHSALFFCEWTLGKAGGDNGNFDMMVCHEYNTRTDELSAAFTGMYAEMEAGR